jgi:hypothetical protein
MLDNDWEQSEFPLVPGHEVVTGWFTPRDVEASGPARPPNRPEAGRGRTDWL